MKQKQQSYIYWAFAGVFFVAVFLYFGLFYGDFLKWQEREILFCYDWNLIRHTLCKIGGFSEFAIQFIIQFFYFPWLGSLLLSSLLLLSVVGVKQVFKQLKISPAFLPLSFVPAILLIIVCTGSNSGILSDLIGFLIGLGFFLVYILFQKPFPRYLIGFLLSAIFFFACGSFHFLFVLWILLYEIRRLKENHEQKNRITAAVYFLALTCFALLLPSIMQHTLVEVSAFKAIANVFEVRWLAYVAGWSFASDFVSPACFIFIAICLFLPRNSREISTRTTLISFGGITVLFLIVTYFVYPKENIRFRKMELAADAGHWEEVLALCDDYWERTPIDKITYKDAFWYFYYTKYALTLTNQLPEKFFSYNLIPGFLILFPEEPPTGVNKFIQALANFYYSVGLMSESLHVSFGVVVGSGLNVRSVERIIAGNLVATDYRANRFFLNTFDKTLFHHRFSEKYRVYNEHPELILKDSLLMKLRNLQPKNDMQAAWVTDMTVFTLWQNNPENQYAFEYAMTAALTYKEHQIVVNNAHYFEDFRYTKIPKNFAEAIILGSAFVKDRTLSKEEILQMKFGGLSLDADMIDRFEHFMIDYEKFENGLIRFAHIRRNYSDTYWFHFFFTKYAPNRPTEVKTSSYDI